MQLRGLIRQVHGTSCCYAVLAHYGWRPMLATAPQCMLCMTCATCSQYGYCHSQPQCLLAEDQTRSTKHLFDLTDPAATYVVLSRVANHDAFVRLDAPCGADVQKGCWAGLVRMAALPADGWFKGRQWEVVCMEVVDASLDVAGDEAPAWGLRRPQCRLWDCRWVRPSCA